MAFGHLHEYKGYAIWRSFLDGRFWVARPGHHEAIEGVVFRLLKNAKAWIDTDPQFDEAGHAIGMKTYIQLCPGVHFEIDDDGKGRVVFPRE
jgi:hypothetical protein